MSSTSASIFLLGTGYVVMTSMWFAFAVAKPVIIIGAGVAGAKVALDLHSKSIDFIIIEATEKVGGRLRQARFGPDRLAVEAGANWLHGYRAENSVSSFHDRFVNLSGLNTKFDDVVFIKNGKKVPYRDANIVYDRFGKALNKVYALARTAKTKNGATTFDLSVRSALLFAAGWEADSPIEKAVEQSYIDYDNAAPGNAVSFHGITPISEPGSPETADYFVADPRGFSSLVTTMLRRAGIKDPLRSGPKLLLKSPVRTVEYGPMTATVTLRDGKRISGSAIVSTVSLGVLQESLFRNPFEPTRLIFSPPLSRRKQLAISKYDFADYLKVFVQFDKPFFKASDPLFIIPLQCEEGQFINIQNLNKKGYLPGSNAVLLTATAAFSRQLTCMDNEGTLREALQFASLAVGRRIHRSEVKAIYYKNWRKDPFFKGSYSTRTVGMTKEDFEALEESSGTLFFAGEAVNDDGLNGYVQGAWNSGARTAQKIANGMSKL